MTDGAKRRIRGRAQAPAREKRPGAPVRDGGIRLSLLVVVSACIHVAVLLAVVYIPGLLPGREKPLTLFTVTMANLPPGPKGGGGREPEPVKPPEKPVKEPEVKKPEPETEPVKIAAKPQKTEPRKQPPKEAEPQKPVAPAGPGQGPVGGGKPGEKFEGPIVLEGGEGIDLGPYRLIIEKRVGGNWRPPKIVSRKKPKVTVSFRIDRNGWIKDIKVEQGSGVPMIDRLAQSAVIDAKRLPPFRDEGLELDSLLVHYTFEVTE